MNCDKCGGSTLHPMTTMLHWTGDLLSSLEPIGVTFVTVTFLCNDCQTLKIVKYFPQSLRQKARNEK